MGDALDPEAHRPAKRIKLASSPEQYHCDHYPHQQLHQESKVWTQEHRPAGPQGHWQRHTQPIPYPPSQPTWRGSRDDTGQPTSQDYHHQQCSPEDAARSSSLGITVASMNPAVEAHDSDPSGNTFFDASWSLSSASSAVPSTSANFFAGDPSEPLDTSGLFPPPARRHTDIPATRLSMSSAPPAPQFYSCSPTNAIEDAYKSYIEPFVAPAASRPAATSAMPLAHQISGQVSAQARPTVASVLKSGPEVSPFHDCIGTFGVQRSQLFNRPSNGKVNGYIKFSWSKDRQQKRPSVADTPATLDSSRIVELKDTSETTAEAEQSASPTAAVGLARMSPSSPGVIVGEIGANKFFNQPWTLRRSSHGPIEHTPSPSTIETSLEAVPAGTPRLVPQHFGFEAKMDNMDRQLWTFYVKNWCPGRTVLQETNLWLKDFAQMHKSDGVRSAIQSLAGIYIYDYMPLDSIRSRVNKRFLDAETRFTFLLNDPATKEDPELADEFITMAVILSMQDIVLTERRLKKPLAPRWLEGFRRGEAFLESTDTGARFWKASNVQFSSLRTSQTIMVGRAVILAQPLASLPPPNQFDAKREASRFGWLLYGTERDMYEIHGGCGFSKKLLHVLGQITYCTARMQQDEESPVTPVTAEYLLNTLLNMRQWSPESGGWDTIKAAPPLIDWVQAQADDYKIESGALMTDVSAEAWRIAAMLYLQCRMLRLPRDHGDVLENLDDLAKCIKIMPTSGTHFTAQAPLFPVFLLGMLATAAEHKAVSKTWFDEVIETPVRSSVPPLYSALQHIWSWIDKEIPESLCCNGPATSYIRQRCAWWESLVVKVQQQEQEVPCLT